METVFILKASDLNLNFLNAVKSLFKKDQEIEVQISSRADLSVLKSETRAQCNARIEKSFTNLKKNRNRIEFTGEEFEALTKKLLKK